jgi:RNA polymerase sigma-70 factor (ECF subfamily)
VGTIGLSTDYLPQRAAGSATVHSDEDLMMEVCQGDARALAELFERHHRQIYAFFFRMTNRREASEDLVQDVFFRILKYRGSYRLRTSFAAWMYSIARNAYVDSTRKGRLEQSFENTAPDVPSPEKAADEELRRRQETDLLRRALSELPPEKREVLVLSRYHDLKYEEIGQILGCEVGAVKVRVFRAVKALAEKFREVSGYHAP